MELKHNELWISSRTESFSDYYTLEPHRLGDEGDYATTFKAIRKSDNNVVAVKVIDKSKISSLPLIQQQCVVTAMKDEIRILNLIRGQNHTVRVEGTYEDADKVYLVMEECKGGTLFDLVCNRTHLSEELAASILRQVLVSVKFLHESSNIMHRDIKPCNIMFSQPVQDNHPNVKLIDFGMSLIVSPFRFLNQPCGTPYYMAPEVLNCRYNHSADLWSVGVTMFVCLFGYPPFYVDGDDFESISKENDAIFQKIRHGFQPIIVNTEERGFGPWFPDNIPVSKEARDLTGKLLNSDVHTRLTAEEALNHGWFSKFAPKSKVQDDDVVSEWCCDECPPTPQSEGSPPACSPSPIESLET